VPEPQHVAAVEAVLPHPRAQASATPAGQRGQLRGTDDLKADDDHAKVGDRHRRQRLAKQEPTAERGDDGADVEDQAQPGRTGHSK